MQLAAETLSISVIKVSKNVIKLIFKEIDILRNFSDYLILEPEHTALLDYARWVKNKMDYKFAKFQRSTTPGTPTIL
jgi:hypothetical protein